MFESVGKKGRVKSLPGHRWLVSSTVALALGGLLTGIVNLFRGEPVATGKPEEIVPDILKIRYHEKIPPVPRVPVQRTLPRSPSKINRTAIRKPIPIPVPTPPPQEQKPERVSEDQEVAFSGDDSSGVPGTGVLDFDANLPPGGANEGGPGTVGRELTMGEIRIVRQVPPVYPEIARRNRITGEATVLITCDPDGRVIDVAWVSGNVIFKDAVMNAVNASQYGPQPFRCSFKQPFKFTLR